MGFIDDKNSLVQQVSLFEVLGDLPNNKLVSNIDSVKSKSFNLIPYLLDLLGMVCKDNTKIPKKSDRLKCDLVRILTEILVDFFPVFMEILKKGIAKGLKAGLLCPGDFKIPSSSLSVTLKPNEFDIDRLTTLNKNEFPASLLFGDSGEDLNGLLADVVQGGNGTTATWKNIMEFENVDIPLNNNNTTMGLKASINPQYIGKEFDVFLKDFLNSTQLFSKKNFVPNLVNQFQGNIDNILNQEIVNLSMDSVTDKEKVDKMVDKILEVDPCSEDFIFDNSFFDFKNDELLDIEKKANNRLNGLKIVNYSCIPTVVDSFNSGQALLSFDQIGDDNQSEKVLKETTFTLINNLASNIDQDNEDSVKKSLSFELAMALPKLSSSVIFSPKIKVLTQFSKNLVTGSIDTSKTNFDFAKANKVFFEYVVRESSAALLKILFDQIKEEIIKIVAGLVLNLIKEAVNKKLNQLRSLTGGFDVKSGLSAIKTPDVSQFL